MCATNRTTKNTEDEEEGKDDEKIRVIEAALHCINLKMIMVALVMIIMMMVMMMMVDISNGLRWTILPYHITLLIDTVSTLNRV